MGRVERQTPILNKIEKMLIIGDPHAHPNYDNERFTWLGNYILEERPDVIVNMGDMADMPSLSSYDRGKGNYEGRRYHRDCEAVREANSLLFSPLDAHNKRRRSNRKKSYNPRRVFLLGNHENRINRAINDDIKLEGTLGIENLDYERHWEVHPYRERITIGGVSFTHHFPAGVSGRPLGGENLGVNLLKKGFMSSVAGHTHVYDYSERTRWDDSKIFGMCAGCYVHPDFVEGWNRDTAAMWWNGVIMLEGVENGFHEKLSTITQKELKVRYS